MPRNWKGFGGLQAHLRRPGDAAPLSSLLCAGPRFIYGRSDPEWHGSCGRASQGYRDFTDAEAGRMRACAIDCHASRCALAPSERRGLSLSEVPGPPLHLAEIWLPYLCIL